MATACLLAPYDSYSIRQTVTIEGDTDRDVLDTYRLDNDLSVV